MLYVLETAASLRLTEAVYGVIIFKIPFFRKNTENLQKEIYYEEIFCTYAACVNRFYLCRLRR